MPPIIGRDFAQDGPRERKALPTAPCCLWPMNIPVWMASAPPVSRPNPKIVSPHKAKQRLHSRPLHLIPSTRAGAPSIPARCLFGSTSHAFAGMGGGKAPVSR